MKVGLIPMAAKLPNIALMRVSEYHKAHGDTVVLKPLPTDGCELVYISTLYTWLRPKVEEVAAHFRGTADVQIGGPGMLPEVTALPDEIDVWPNDYDLYPGMDYGMGYTTRGCIRSCAFCPVPKIEGKMREDVAIGELLNPRSKKVALLDNNFFAAESWRDKIDEIRRRELIVDWPQGNDIRLMTPEIATALGDLRDRHQISGDTFTKPGWLHFAWDLPANDARTEDVVQGITTLFDAGFGPNNLRFYLLVGFPGYTLEEELHRISTLHNLGIEPYVMVYRDYSEKDNRDPVRSRLRDWNNGHGWRSCSFKDFSVAQTKGNTKRGMERMFSD